MGLIKVKGKVVKGKGKGKKFGYPTANMAISREIDSGVYYGKVAFGSAQYQAALFIPPDGKILEVHVLGFDGDLYEKEIEVIIEGKLREAIGFKSEEELIAQIKEDVAKIKRMWKV